MVGLFFSKVNLMRGYHQIPVAPKDVPKTSIMTLFGLYEFLHMPFGLRNAGETFQQLMDCMLQGLDGVFVYMDDILIANNSQWSYSSSPCLIHPSSGPRTYCAAGEVSVWTITASLLQTPWFFWNTTPALQSCCCLPVSSTHHRVAALVVPWTCELLSPFPAQSSHLLHPLHHLCGARPSCTLAWSDHALSALADAKHPLTTAVTLAPLSPYRPHRISTDTSDQGMGVVLEQYTWRTYQILGAVCIIIWIYQQFICFEASSSAAISQLVWCPGAKQPRWL